MEFARMTQIKMNISISTMLTALRILIYSMVVVDAGGTKHNNDQSLLFEENVKAAHSQIATEIVIIKEFIFAKAKRG